MKTDDSRGPSVFIVTCSVQAASFIVLILAFTGRAFIVRKLSAHDWTMVAAWVLAFAMSFAVCYGTQHGLGRHDADIDPVWAPRINRSVYAFSILYQSALMAQKNAVLLLYLDLLATSVATKYFTWVTMAIVNFGGLALTLLSSFRCSPVAVAWASLAASPSTGSCISLLTIYLSSAPLNIITDVAILLIPMPTLCQLTLPRRQRLALVITFGFGVFVTVVDVIRIAYLEQAFESVLSNLFDTGVQKAHTTQDFSWSASYGLMWSVVEVNVGIMCSCVPALKPWASRLRSFWHSHTLERINLDTPAMELPSLSALRLPTSTVSDDHITTATSQRSLSSEASAKGYAVSKGPPLSNVQPIDNIDDYTRSTIITVTKRKTRPRYGLFAALTLLFFVWGFEYGMLFILNQEFQAAAHFTPSQAIALHSAYYAGYVCGPFCLAYWTMTKLDLKWTCLTGLSIYACGSLLFWPAAVLNSYPAYFISNFVAGFGLSNLEVAADTWMFLFSSPRYAATRLCLSQGVQAVGTVTATLIMEFAVQSRGADPAPTVRLQWIYLGIALGAIVLAVIYFFVPVQTIELRDQSRDEAGADWPGWRRAQHVAFVLVALCQLFYVGGQEVNATTMGILFADWTQTFWRPSAATAVAQSAFAISRFLTAILATWTKPDNWLFVFFAGVVLFESLTLGPQFSSKTSAALLIVELFMEGPMFPLIFARAMQHRGSRTYLAACIMTTTIGGGGAIFAPIANAIRNEGTLNSSGQTARRSLLVAVAVYGSGLTSATLLKWLDHRLERREDSPGTAKDGLPGRCMSLSTTEYIERIEH